MPLKTVAVSAALTPTVISTWFSHYLHRKSHHNKPSVHLSYDEGIHVLREFLAFASKHPLEDLQEFTRQWVPSPVWVRTESIEIPYEYLISAANTLVDQLGPNGIKKVGGREWWQWRGPAEGLTGEWMEMRNDYIERKKVGEDKYAGRNRIILYIHGGAYYFGSIDTHRYQMQRHARKLGGRLFAPTYRLAPQFPFPCALQDCLAAYLWLLSMYEPKEIILAGDSAGGGAVLSMLVTIRDQGLPSPAGGVLISPWVDLTHSFPSIVANNPGDYIPSYGFRHKPSPAWPPPNADEILAMKKEASKALGKTDVEKALPKESGQDEDTAKKGYALHPDNSTSEQDAHPGQQGNGQDPEQDEPDNISVPVDGESVEIKDQIHMYATNHLLSHPLVSPALQPSLGGLPPLLILTGGGEMLRDEQIYVAHKAANPTAYPPGDVYLDEYDPNGEILNKYPPTCVQLQVWDDLCHVAPALSFTRPAKYMFRSISQFGAWAFARAQHLEVDILVNNDPPMSSTESENYDSSTDTGGKGERPQPVGAVGKAGDPLPAFQGHMIRQRVSKRGDLYPLDPPSSYAALEMPASQVGAFNPVLVKKWLAAKHEWDEKYAKDKLRVQQQRLKELYHEFQTPDGQSPPPSSLAARRAAQGPFPPRGEQKSYLMTKWNHWASKHDERLIAKAGKDGVKKRSVVAGPAGASMEDDEGATPGPAGRSNGEAASSGRKGVVIDADAAGRTIEEERNKRSTGDDMSIRSEASQPGSPRTYKSSFENPRSPLLVLPDYDNNKVCKEENASTKGIIHAAGTIPPSASDISLPRFKTQRPASSRANSGYAYTDMDDTNSTVADDKSLAVTTHGISDNASTRAVLHSTGVVGVVGDDSSVRQSTDALSSHHDVDGVGKEELISMATSRPGMPERDVFQTADEFQK